MIWLFLILAASLVAVFWVGFTLYLKIRNRVREAEARPHSHDTEHHEIDHLN